MQFAGLSTTGTVAGDTPELINPLRDCFQNARLMMSREVSRDPAPDFTCPQIADTTNWLKSLVQGMEQHNDGFSKHGMNNLDDAELHRNQAKARESAMQLTHMFADTSKKFSQKLPCPIVEFKKGVQSQEIKENLTEFSRFLTKFGDAKWLGVLPEFAEQKRTAVGLLRALRKRSAVGGPRSRSSSSSGWSRRAQRSTTRKRDRTIFEGIAEGTLSSAGELQKLAQMARALALTFDRDAASRRQAEQDLDKKMELLKAFAEAMHEVPKVLRQFLLIRSGSIKDDLLELKAWVSKEEADAIRLQLEEFRDEASEEKVVRRLQKS